MLSSLVQAVGLPLGATWIRRRLPWWVQALVGFGGAIAASRMVKHGKTAKQNGEKPHLLGVSSWNVAQGAIAALLAFRRRPRRLRL